MKKLRFEKLELLSTKERKAKIVEFHPRLTVISGVNDVGKSSLIKSIYWTFGAQPKSIHRSWRDANVSSPLTFNVDNVRFFIFRRGNAFAIFDSNEKLLLSTTSIMRDLTPFIANLLNFRLVLASRQNRPETPPPAFAFLPFYINQESGWDKPLTSFENLAQYPNFRDTLIDFHSGIIGNEYYVLNAQKKEVKFEIEERYKDKKYMSRALDRLDISTNFYGLELSIEEHEDAIERILRLLRDLKIKRQKRAAELAQIIDLRLSLANQINIAKHAISELEGDLQYASSLGSEVRCPVCNSIHSNDFVKRYKIVDDREACLDFILASNEMIKSMTKDVEDLEIQIRDSNSKIIAIQNNLAEKKEDVTLLDVIRNEGQKMVLNTFDQQISSIDAEIGRLNGLADRISSEQNGFKSPARRNEIENFYASMMGKFLNELDVLNYDARALTKINASINESGSDQPRAVLAYSMALLHTINRYGSSFVAPMVIDSPNQQDQDKINVAAMIKIVAEKMPDGIQAILGSVELHGVDLENAKVIQLNQKLSVLQSSDYEIVSERIASFIKKII